MKHVLYTFYGLVVLFFIVLAGAVGAAVIHYGVEGIVWWHEEHTTWAARLDVFLIVLPVAYLVGRGIQTGSLEFNIPGFKKKGEVNGN